MLRKLIIFAITSGLAKKAYDAYKTRQTMPAPLQTVPPHPTHRRATTVSAPTSVGVDY